MHRRRLPSLCLLGSLLAAPAWPGGGPRNVLVVINENAPESLELGNTYRRARGIPAGNVCRLQTSTALSVSKTVYQSELEDPVEACIAASPYAARIDYIVLTRGLPIRASFPGGNVATTALLQALDTTLRGKDQEFNPPTFVNYPNGYRRAGESFSHARTFGGRNLYLATMLTGYWTADARALIDRSLASDLAAPSSGGGVFFLEEARAPANRRNNQLPAAASLIAGRGLTAQVIRHAEPDVTGAIVASHLNGGVYSAISKSEIDSNTYPPGCLVDVLESFGFVPNNLTPGANRSQVPIAWWIAAGVTGAHGTVSEPYDVAFPDADLFEPYLDGFNLAESFFQGIPYLYWMNLVVGDPLAAPYATRPDVVIAAPVDRATVSGAVLIDASATTAAAAGIVELEVFVDDVLLATVPGAAAMVPWDTTAATEGLHRIEVVAYEDSVVFTQATAGVDVFIDNAGVSIAITNPAPATLVTGTFAATVTASASVTDVTLFSGDVLVGSATGAPPFTVDVDTSLLGAGIHTLVAEGTGSVADSRSDGVEVEVVKAPLVNSLSPVRGPAAGGTTVAIDGWYFTPAIRVYFDAVEAASATWIDEHHVEVVTPPGMVGPVDVRLDDRLATSTTVTNAYTYGCAVTAAPSDLRVVAEADGRLRFVWTDLGDPCWLSYRMFELQDPTSRSPAFPGDFSDITSDDEDGDRGGDPTALYDPPTGTAIVWFEVAADGSDGSLGPR